MSLYQEIHNQLSKTLSELVPQEFHPVDPMLKETSDPKFGDYQSNVAMSLAKKMKANPRDLAQSIIDKSNLEGLCSSLEIAGPGFINLTVRSEALAEGLVRASKDDRLGVPCISHPYHHVVDFAGPNLAKEMHVGHLRTTITGEVICRVLEFLGHSVERVSHVGDWGTQFGMLLEYIYEHDPKVVDAPDQFEVNDLESFYKKAKGKFDEDEDFARRARERVVSLQSGDPKAIKLWKAFLQESLRHCHAIFKDLDVTIEDRGESFYNERLPGVIEELKGIGVAKEDDGAVCVFLDGYTNRDGEPLPLIIQKSDGGYNYATTDLAAITHRIKERHAKRLIYVTDLRQAQHFKMVFETAQLAKWADETVELNHIGYGMVLGKDKKPFKTRDGGTVQLKALIQESVTRARKMIADREFSEDKAENIARSVGLAAMKYADLSHNLASDYVFDWDQMLSMEGNTGPYMLYAHARIMSIGRKGGFDLYERPKTDLLILEHPTERHLGLVLSKFSDVVGDIARQLKPNILTDYLYGLSKAFSTFYDKNVGVSVLDAETEELKQSRLLLCYLTARTLRMGLNLLSISVVDEM